MYHYFHLRSNNSSRPTDRNHPRIFHLSYLHEIINTIFRRIFRFRELPRKVQIRIIKKKELIISPIFQAAITCLQNVKTSSSKYNPQHLKFSP